MSRTRPPREWLAYEFHDARAVLLKLNELEREIAGITMDDRVRRLRTRSLRPYHERRQAAIFCYGMGVVCGTQVAFAPVENEDFDCIACWMNGDHQVFTAIQLKELPPSDLNPTATLDSELQKLTKYARSHDLVVAFHVNRRTNVTFSDLVIPKLPISELWFFGSVAPDGREFMIWGNALADPQYHQIAYPTE